MDEKRLIARAKRDPQAFGDLYELYIDRVFKYVKVRVGDTTVTEDIVSDIWFKALKSIDRYDHRGKPFAAWLFTIVSNSVKDHYRQKKTVVPLGQVEDTLISPDKRTDSVLTSIEINRSLGNLTNEQREAVLLRYAGDLQIRDIAAVLGKTEGAVKGLLTRALKCLREEMKGGQRDDTMATVS